MNNKNASIFLLSIGPAAGVDIIHLETSHLSGLLRKHGYEYYYIEITDSYSVSDKLIATVEEESAKAIVLIEGRFERYVIVKEIVQLLKRRMSHGVIILWGPMAATEYDSSICSFLKGTRKCLSGPFGVIEEIAKCLAKPDKERSPATSQDNGGYSHPDYLSMPIAEYIHKYNNSSRFWNILASRGCASECVFCTRARKKLAYRDIACLAAEISWLQQNHRIQRFCFVDDNFLLSHKRVRQLMGAINDIGSPISFRFQGRVDRLNEPILLEMIDRGLSGISMGIESGNQSILDSLNKKIKLRDTYRVLELLNKHNISYHGTFIVGAPMESEKSIQDTHQLIHGFFKKSYKICYLKPMPGTILYRQAVRDRLINDERAYCEKLVPGYDQLLVNLTQYDDTTVIGWKQYLETV